MQKQLREPIPSRTWTSQAGGNRFNHHSADLNAYKSNYFLITANVVAIGNFDADGRLTNADMQGLLSLLASGGGSAAAVPEPGTLSLLALGGCLAMAIFWRESRRST